MAKRLPTGEAPFPFRRMVLEYKATEQRSDLANAPMANEVKMIERLDRLAGRGQGEQVEFFAKFGTQMQIANFSTGREVCTFGAARRGAARPAATLYPSSPANGRTEAPPCRTP